MAHYIDKDALEGEIEKLISEIYKGQPFDSLSREKQVALWYVKSIMCSIDMLEVKENDFVEEMDYADYVRFFKEHPDYNDVSWGFEETWTFAQYCYKLGLKAQKG